MKHALIALLLFLSLSTSASADTTLTWRGQPLSIDIPVGIERVIRFDANKVQVGIPRDLAGIASAESNNGFVYLRAARPFGQKRFRFRDKETGRIYAIDVTASDAGAFQPVHVVDETVEPTIPDPLNIGIEATVDPTWPVQDSLDQDTLDKNTLSNHDDSAATPVEHAPVAHPYTSLTRYAMQQLYAPARLMTPLDDLVSVSVRRTELTALVPGASVSAQILGQWRNLDHLVTALVLHNTSDQVVHLDPRAMRGNQYWLTAALIRDWLSPVNQSGERTGLVVISQQQWTDYPWLQR